MSELRDAPSPLRRAGTLLGVLVVAGLLVGAGWWAGQATLVSPIADAATSKMETPSWGTAQEASVGRTLPVSVTVRQPATLAGENHLSGVVTSANPGTREQGEVVYTVGDVPVRVIEGTAPLWRDLTTGANGADVEALQRALKDLGHLRGAVDGKFGPGTRQGVMGWQKELGVKPTGEVPLGEVVTARHLPAQITLGEAIAPGRAVSGGEEAVLATVGEHEFVLIVGEGQAQLIPVEATVNITYQDHEWDAVITSVEEDANQNTVMTLHSPGGGPVCGQDCAALPADEEISLLARVLVIPPVSGIGIPTAAITTDAGGQAWVTTRTGRASVEVLGAGQGVTIVKGIEEGTEVQLDHRGQGDGADNAEEHPPNEEAPPADVDDDGEDQG